MFKRTHVALVYLFIFFGLAVSSCAPVKFTKSEEIQVVVDDTKSVQCNPKINDNLMKYTYSDNTNPRIASQCVPSANVTYQWTVKNAAGQIINTVIPGLTGANPSSINFRHLGVGSYYVFLKATDDTGVLSAYNSSVPLEFTVPGSPGTLACDPKLNSTYTSVVVGSSDPNPALAANCSPVAQTYNWKVYKGSSGSTEVVVPNLSGASSTPDFKSLGDGEYRIYLYATLTNAPSWQSSSPLNVKVTSGGQPPSDPIKCNPRINGSLTSLTLTPSSANPLISANCLPSSVQYNWTVTKNGQTVVVSGLSGANSNPNFLANGQGTYLIYLTASKPGVQSWTATAPLMLVVESGNPQLTLNCAPRLNNTYVSMNIPITGANPTVSSGCNPSNVAHVWTVTKNGQAIALPISGASSTPNFTGAGLGTYLIYLTASSPNYNTYVSPSPLEVTVSQGGSNVRHVTYTKQVLTTDNKVDILLVVDDSASMLSDNLKLAQKMQGFVNDLTNSGLDWQMCSTITRAQLVGGAYYWGASRNWVNYLGSPKWILKLGATDPYAIFTQTIEQIGAGWADTDDERAIKAAYWHAEYASSNNCYRSDASLAVIILSDEDERSVGGNSDYQYYYGEYKALDADDYPQAYINKIKQKFGSKKPVSVNSIIVKPRDTTCMTTQDAGGLKSHYGYKYKELSDMTQGYVGSICDSDYSQSLYYFKDKIKQSLSSIPLECAPVGQVSVSITPVMGTVTTTIVNNTLVFNPVIPSGRTVTVGYDCPMN